MTRGILRLDHTVDLAARPGVQRVRRLPTEVRVHFAQARGVVETAEGAVSHAAGAAVLTGGGDERWPVERSRFEAGYEPVPPTRMGDDGLYRHRPSLALAQRFDHAFEVVLPGRRGILRGGPGDWLLQYAPGEVGVVSAAAFARTYELVA